MLVGYITNGPPAAPAIMAIELLDQIRYRDTGFTLDHGPLNPFADNFDEELTRTADRLRDLNMRSVAETEGCFLL
jgi:hypothetical protein